MPVFRLSGKYIFPPTHLAEPDGLLAIGGDLSPARLITAYANGIFPWYSGDDPILWWSPAPRLVLFPEEFHLPRSLQRTINRQRFNVTADRAFAEVIASCANAPHRKEQGTWITPAMQQAYSTLHELGFAHSIESWQDGELSGGLYGVCIDNFFFGESMFTKVTDGSKVALAALVAAAPKLGINIIDCQMTTAHLLRFGAREISREVFQEQLEANIDQCRPQKKWCL
ncbi:MAG: leucyl/phenylalanyl-tRNA--protein transferase [Desulfobulbus propionicus]|nr:MAG: leucyl/phenylalanyl-tRNA--protein transferase [Desulfobulbus propionicus]